MHPVPVPAGTRLSVTYSFHEAPHSVSDRAIVLHHGICHTRETFLPLIAQLNALGIHVAMIDQQSENSGFFRNFIGAKSYREGMAAAVRTIENDHPQIRIGSYAVHSMGALIGEEMQQKYPELRRSTVLMAPIPVNGALPISLRMLKRHPLSYLKAVLTLDIHSLAKTPEQVRELFFDSETPEELVVRTTAQLKHAPFWMYCQLVLRRLVRPKIRNDGLPKMLLTSETDEIFHPEEYKNTRDLYRPLEEHHFAGGHDFFIVSAEQTAERIADFHSRTQPPPAADHPPASPPHFRQRPEGVKSSEGEKKLTADDQ